MTDSIWLAQIDFSLAIGYAVSYIACAGDATNMRADSIWGQTIAIRKERAMENRL